MTPFNHSHLLLKAYLQVHSGWGWAFNIRICGGGTIQFITPAITLFSSTDHLSSSGAALLLLRKVDIGGEMAGVTLCSEFENGSARCGGSLR